MTLDDMSALTRGWNGYDAEPPSGEATGSARAYLTTLSGGVTPDRVAPSAVGGVGCTFRGRQTGRFVYVEFYNDGHYHTLFSRGEGVEPETSAGLPTGEEIGAFLDNPWHPIETAPKDGTHVLLYRRNPRAASYDEAWWRLDTFVNEYEWGGASWSYPTLDQPTHWMPLPPPPDDSSPEPESLDARDPLRRETV